VSDWRLRHLPPVHAVLAEPELAGLLAVRGREVVVAAVRSVVDEAREAGQDDPHRGLGGH
jgi:hypothetical protein